jgi:4-amino-4-deoxy-L-arabinose transferase-like glycosyltransferase
MKGVVVKIIKNIKLWLIILTLVGAFLRFYNINWDKGLTFHPDERNIDAAVSRISFFDQLNPEFFAYGGLPIYLYRAVGEIVYFITKDHSWLHSWGKINIIGRSFSALFSTLSIPAAYFLAKKLFNKRVAILSAFFTTFTVAFIQTAHYGITESFLAFMAILISSTALSTLSSPTAKNYLKNGVLLSFATAAKTSGISFLVYPLTAHLLTMSKSITSSFLLREIKRARYLIFFLLVALAVFLILSPFTILSWDKFMESMHYESGVVAGNLQVPYTLQFTNTVPYLFQIKNLFWQLGPFALFSLVGFVFLFFNKKIDKKKRILFLSFPLVYFIYVGSWHTKFIRYMVPILPFFVLFASYLLIYIKRKFNIIGTFLIIIICLLTVSWAMAFFTIYTREQTRIEASKWIYKNIPKGSTILSEHWDDGLPVNLPEQIGSPSLYNIEQLTIYEPDDFYKIDYYANKLSNADYIIINSRRLYGTLINLKEKYPITSLYYEKLFDGSIGFYKVAQFTSYPQIFGFQIVDDKSEETFQVYDHPKVLIFKNTQRLDVLTLEKLLRENGKQYETIHN